MTQLREMGSGLQARSEETETLHALLTQLEQAAETSAEGGREAATQQEVSALARASCATQHRQTAGGNQLLVRCADDMDRGWSTAQDLRRRLAEAQSTARDLRGEVGTLQESAIAQRSRADEENRQRVCGLRLSMISLPCLAAAAKGLPIVLSSALCPVECDPAGRPNAAWLTSQAVERDASRAQLASLTQKVAKLQGALTSSRAEATEYAESMQSALLEKSQLQLAASQSEAVAVAAARASADVAVTAVRAELLEERGERQR
eukprot:COSAG02_NODE_12651_length_1514_cov_1.103180_3_plen_263_part_00